MTVHTRAGKPVRNGICSQRAANNNPRTALGASPAIHGMTHCPSKVPMVTIQEQATIWTALSASCHRMDARCLEGQLGLLACVRMGPPQPPQPPPRKCRWTASVGACRCAFVVQVNPQLLHDTDEVPESISVQHHVNKVPCIIPCC